MITPVQKLIGLLVLVVALIAGSAAITWQIQGWRYGKQLAEQAGLHQHDLIAIRNVAAAPGARRSGQALGARAAVGGQRPNSP